MILSYVCMFKIQQLILKFCVKSTAYHGGGGGGDTPRGHLACTKAVDILFFIIIPICL